MVTHERVLLCQLIRVTNNEVHSNFASFDHVIDDQPQCRQVKCICSMQLIDRLLFLSVIGWRRAPSAASP